MREIEFRGKELNPDSFHYVDWCYGSLVYSPSEDQYYIVEHCDEELSFPVSKITIGQYTGQKDKNGTKIFGDDIVIICGDVEDIAVINWDNDCAMFTILQDDVIYNFDQYYGRELEVIGNIHDNPELLEMADLKNKNGGNDET